MSAIEFLQNLLEKNAKAAALILIACFFSGSIGGGLYIETLLSRIEQQKNLQAELKDQLSRTKALISQSAQNHQEELKSQIRLMKRKQIEFLNKIDDFKHHTFDLYSILEKIKSDDSNTKVNYSELLIEAKRKAKKAKKSLYLIENLNDSFIQLGNIGPGGVLIDIERLDIPESDDFRIYRKAAVLFMQYDNDRMAEIILLEGLQKNPISSTLFSRLYSLYLRQGRKDDAKILLNKFRKDHQ